MRIEIPDEKKLVHETTFPIRWGDMDALGHVNNAVYFTYLEVVRVEWLHSIDAPLDPSGEGPVTVNAFCNFIKQLEYPGTVRAKHYVANVGRSSFDTYVTLERTDDPGVVYAAGGATTVWVDFKAKRSVPLPERIRALIA